MGRSWAIMGRSWADHGRCWVLVGFRSLRLGFGGFSKLTAGFSAFVMAGNQHVLQNEHALAQWLATSTAWRRNMRSVDGWQIRASPPRAPYRPMSAHDLPMICPWSPLYLQVGTVKMRKQIVLVIFFRFSQNSERSQFFLKKIDFFKYFLIFFSKILNLGSPNTPFRTSGSHF